MISASRLSRAVGACTWLPDEETQPPAPLGAIDVAGQAARLVSLSSFFSGETFWTPCSARRFPTQSSKLRQRYFHRHQSRTALLRRSTSSRCSRECIPTPQLAPWLPRSRSSDIFESFVFRPLPGILMNTSRDLTPRSNFRPLTGASFLFLLGIVRWKKQGDCPVGRWERRGKVFRLLLLRVRRTCLDCLLRIK